MGFITWRFGPKEEVSRKALIHSTIGEFNSNGRLSKGGHSQKNIDQLNKNKQKYHIVKIYKNGVRVGNVENHTDKMKRYGTRQSRFPKWWNDNMVKRAGQVVARGEKLEDGYIKSGFYGNVNVGIIRRNRMIATIFPLSVQRNRKVVEIHEHKKTKRGD